MKHTCLGIDGLAGLAAPADGLAGVGGVDALAPCSCIGGVDGLAIRRR